MSLNRKNRFINRELSWLEFNQRVLNEATDNSIPLLDRLMFLAITASNLDEFIMVRVGGLKLLIEQGIRKKAACGMTPKQQLQTISSRVRQMIKDQYACYNKTLLPLLKENLITHLKPFEFTNDQSSYAELLFQNEIYPMITPMSIDPDMEPPLLQNMCIYIAVRLKTQNGKDHLAIMPTNQNLDRFITLPGDNGYNYILLEELVCSQIQEFFNGSDVLEAVPFRITRNADLTAREDFTPDFLAEMESVLSQRQISDCVRLEVSNTASKAMLKTLQQFTRMAPEDIYNIPGPLDLSAFSSLVFMDSFHNLRYQQWEPQPSPDIDMTNSIFDEISKRDILLCHPFDSYEPVLQLIEKAANDPDVLAIKQTLYRTSSDSRVMAALNQATLNGKQVTAIVELKARFDEAANIKRARELEAAGAQIIYGIKGLKTHSKICIIVRRERTGIARYVHYGTGNYNEKTAKLYTDISLLTREPNLGRDASTFFNTVSGYSEPQPFLKISAAPTGLREKLLNLIEEETERCEQGQKGQIMAKMNSLVDPEIINALYKASEAGVKIKLNVRGICCLRAGVKGLSSNISVVSIIDRYLEHSRIFYFRHGGVEQIYISSADWMPRNLDRRIELMIPVDDPICRKRLRHVLEVCLSDTAKGYELLPDNTYIRRSTSAKGKLVRSQELLYKEACERVANARKAKYNIFELHRPKKSKNGKK